MSDIQIDIPDITVIVNPAPQYVSNINLPSIVPIVDGNYYSIADFAVTSQTASYALNAQGTGFPYSGSAEITGSLQVVGGTISGSFEGDGSNLTGVTSTGISGGSSSYIPLWSSSTTLSSSAIYQAVDTIIINKSVDITGSLDVTGTISANQLIVTNLISSSILYESGSTKFGNTLDDTHQFTGSLVVSGSSTFIGDQIISGSLITTADSMTLIGNLVVTGSVIVDGNVTGSLFGTASAASTAVFAVSASYIDGGYY